MNWFMMFRDKIRPLRGFTAPNDYFFVTVTGVKVTHLTNDLKELARRAGENVVLAATAVRKGIATVVAHHSLDATKRIVSSHMGHSSETADNYYVSYNSAETHIQATQAIKRAVKGTSGQDDDI